MAKENETITEIIAEMLGARTEFPFVYLMGEPDTPEVIDFKTKEIMEPRKINIRRVTVKELADRIEAAHKRELDELKKKVGNAAKLREALCDTLNAAFVVILRHGNATEEMGRLALCVDNARAALAAPARNCDVGTAMEQGERFSAYCRAHKHPESECLTCPLFGQTGGYCELAWAQMPYESEAAK